MWQFVNHLISGFWYVLTEMSPYLLFGFIVAGILSILISPETVERNLGKRGIWSVFKAALFGVPLPLCSCGVIPVAASLRRHGANKSATTAFLISTPQTGVDSIFATYSLLGGVFAVFRPIAAFVNGIIGGILVELLDRNKDHKPEQIIRCEADCCSPQQKGGKIRRIIRYGLYTLPQDIGKELLIGLVLAALITAAIPDDYFSDYLGSGIISMLVMMAIGIPIYVCATASVPIAAAFIAKGISPGAALVFLMTGPATNTAAIVTIWKVLGKRTTVIFLATVGITALICGFIMDLIISNPDMVMAHHIHHSTLPVGVKVTSAFLLVGFLSNALIKRKGEKIELLKVEESMRTVILPIKGMTCSHCAANVQKALSECPGVVSARVDLNAGKAYISGTDFQLESLRKAVEAIGYSAGAPEERG